MKEFFEQCLRDLHSLTGLKQYLEICNKPTEAEAKQEMEFIVNGMVRVSEKFNYIPLDAQKRIIKHQMVSDPEIYALNAKMVYKWFNAVSDKYWKESGYLETNERLEQETEVKPLSKETESMIEQFKASLASGTIKEVPSVGKYEIEKIKTEDKIKQSSALSIGIPLPTVEQLERRELHRQWILENFDKITGKPLENFLDEPTWLELKKK